MPRSPRSIRNFINEKKVLRDLQSNIDFQNKLTEEIRSLLPSPLNSHIQSARLIDNIVTIHTDTPAWAARLRFLAAALTNQLKASYPNIKAIKIRIIYLDKKPKPTLKAAKKSSIAADIIHKNAINTKDKDLKQALERLSTTLRGKPSSHQT